MLTTIMTSMGRLAMCAALAALTLVLWGCGGQHRQASALQRGKAVFAAACTSCHTLTGRDSRAAGGDLAIGRFSVPDIESFARIMPVHLSRADVHAVAVYVHSRMVARARAS